MSIKRNIQAFREWAYSIDALIIESKAFAPDINPNLNSKERNRLKWQSQKKQLV
jgi:hypothetical protein